MALWWAPVGLVWAREEDHTTPSKHGARCCATFPRIVLDKDVGGEVQGPGEGHGASERTRRSRHGVIFHRETLSALAAEATRVEWRLETKLRVVFALIKRGNRLLYRRPSL